MLRIKKVLYSSRVPVSITLRYMTLTHSVLALFALASRYEQKQSMEAINSSARCAECVAVYLPFLFWFSAS
jgi:hypothetical protein